LELFRDSGPIFGLSDDLFSETSWLAVILGQDVTPQKYDPVVDSVPVGAMQRAVLELKAAIFKATRSPPDRSDFLQSYCGNVRDNNES